MQYSIPALRVEAQYNAGCSQCVTRQMTPEERQKYGPPVKKTRATIAKLWEAKRQAKRHFHEEFWEAMV